MSQPRKPGAFKTLEREFNMIWIRSLGLGPLQHEGLRYPRASLFGYLDPYVDPGCPAFLSV